MKFFVMAAVAALLVALPSLPIRAQDTPLVISGTIELTGAFTRAMPPAATSGGGFVSITNHGDMDDRLTGVTSPHASVVEIHLMVVENDIMRMSPVEDGLVIPAGETITLAPGGYHMMFMQVSVPFAEGENVPVTLRFEHAGDIEIMLTVAQIGASEMPMHMDTSK